MPGPTDPACAPLSRQHLPVEQQGWPAPTVAGTYVPALPYVVALTACLMGVVALGSLGAFIELITVFDLDRSTGGLFAGGLIMATSAIIPALVASGIWSFARNGRLAGPLAVGMVLLLMGGTGLVAGLLNSNSANGIPLGLVGCTLGVFIVLLPFTGAASTYLSALRQRARAQTSEHLADASAQYQAAEAAWGQQQQAAPQTWPQQPHDNTWQQPVQHQPVQQQPYRQQPSAQQSYPPHPPTSAPPSPAPPTNGLPAPALPTNGPGPDGRWPVTPPPNPYGGTTPQH
jgi:hypothetical protein